MIKKQSEAFHTFLWLFFPSLKQNFIAYCSSNVSSRPDCIFEIYQLWQSGFCRVYSNCCCSGSFEPEIIKIGQSSQKMYSNNILNFQDSTTILNACTKKSENLLKTPRSSPKISTLFMRIYFILFLIPEFYVMASSIYILDVANIWYNWLTDSRSGFNPWWFQLWKRQEHSSRLWSHV